MMRRIRSPRRLSPPLSFPSLTPRNFPEYVVGNCRVALFTGRWALDISVPLNRSMYDRIADLRDWEPLRRGLRIGFDGDETAFRIKRALVRESTLCLTCEYPGKGTLERIRRLAWLRLARANEPVSGVLLEVLEAKTIRSTGSKNDGLDRPPF